MEHPLSVAEVKLLLAEFRAELVKDLERFATATSVDLLEKRVRDLELWQAGSKTLSAAQKFWFGTIGVGLIGAVSTLVWLATSSGGHG